MILQTLALEGFRNYAGATVAFSPGVNLLHGENAQGKTNLLEAVAYLSLGRSRRARTERDLIGWTCEQAALTGVIDSRGRQFTVAARFRRGVRRRLTINGVPCKNAGELGTVLRTVFFCPDDLSLIRDGADVRRRFMDDAICQLRPRYAAALVEHNRLYAHKTRILRDFQKKPSLLEPLDDFNLRLCRVGAIILHYRAQFVRSLAERAAGIHRAFSGEREVLEMSYQTIGTVRDPFLPVAELVPLLAAHQAAHRSAELDARLCLSGIHKDDLVLSIDGRSARQFASQGQTRTAALSLKLAEREVHFADAGQYPILLLDDVLSELDPKRQEFVLSRIHGGQVLITCCDSRGLDGIQGKRIHIAGGEIV